MISEEEANALRKEVGELKEALQSLVEDNQDFLRKFGERGKRKKRYTKVAQRPASESEQAVLANE